MCSGLCFILWLWRFKSQLSGTFMCLNFGLTLIVNVHWFFYFFLALQLLRWCTQSTLFFIQPSRNTVNKKTTFAKGWWRRKNYGMQVKKTEVHGWSQGPRSLKRTKQLLCKKKVDTMEIKQITKGISHSVVRNSARWKDM